MNVEHDVDLAEKARQVAKENVQADNVPTEGKLHDLVTAAREKLERKRRDDA